MKKIALLIFAVMLLLSACSSQKEAPYFDLGMKFQEIIDVYGLKYSVNQETNSTDKLYVYHDFSYKGVTYRQFDAFVNEQDDIVSLSFTYRSAENHKEQIDKMINEWVNFLTNKHGEPTVYDNEKLHNTFYSWETETLGYRVYEETDIEITLIPHES